MPTPNSADTSVGTAFQLLGPQMSAQTASIQAERRASPRTQARGRVMLMRCDGQHPESQRTCSLTLLNTSAAGLVGEGPIALKHTERVTVLFPPRGSTKGHDRYGLVVRCQPNPDSPTYLIAIHFNDNPNDLGD